MAESDRRQDEGGFTIVEVLIAVTILSIVMGALGGALLIGFRTLDGTPNRVVSSTDAQFVSVYFPPDVQSASTGTTSVSCSNSGTTSPKLRLTLHDGGAEPGTVVYWVRTVSAESYELVRSEWNTANCDGPPPKSTVVARNVAGASNDDVSVTPLPASGAQPPGYRITVKTKTTTNDPNQYEFKVTGRMRAPVPA